MSSLFIEASAKTAVGVREAFQEVVEQILDTPELWAPVGSSGNSSSGGGDAKGDGGKAGEVDLRKEEGEVYSGCSC
jgi:Ras-related protein Rab-18